MLDLAEIIGIMMSDGRPLKSNPWRTSRGDGMGQFPPPQGRGVKDHVLDWIEEREMDLHGAHEQDDPLCNL